MVMPWGWAGPQLDAEPQLEGGLGGKVVEPHCQGSDVKSPPSPLFGTCDPRDSVTLLWGWCFNLMIIQQ